LPISSGDECTPSSAHGGSSFDVLPGVGSCSIQHAQSAGSASEVGHLALDLVGDRNRCCLDDIGNEERGRLDFLGAAAALAIER
jgi:hypothetical protein